MKGYLVSSKYSIRSGCYSHCFATFFPCSGIFNAVYCSHSTHAPWSSSLASPGSFLETQIMGPHPGPALWNWICVTARSRGGAGMRRVWTGLAHTSLRLSPYHLLHRRLTGHACTLG